MSDELVLQDINKPLRDEKGQLLPGNTANPNGRPKGKTLKEFARDLLMTMNEEEKVEYLKTLPKDIVWKMAEGNPHQTSESEVKGEQMLIIGDSKIAAKFDEFLKQQSKDQ